jgi:hypothetical protein
MDQIIDPHFAGRRLRYLAQVALATATLFVIFALQDAFSRPAILTAIASSAFIVFVNPTGVMAQPRRIVGGHGVAIAVAAAFSVLVHDLPFSTNLDHGIILDAFAALAVGATMLGMAITNTEHAPAAGTVLGLMLSPWSFKIAALVTISAFILAGVRARWRERLSDLV